MVALSTPETNIMPAKRGRPPVKDRGPRDATLGILLTKKELEEIKAAAAADDRSASAYARRILLDAIASKAG